MSPTKTRTRKRVAQKAATTSAPLVVTTSFTLDEEVTHPKFGDGTITDLESNKLTIKFSDGRVKQILDYYVKRRAR